MALALAARSFVRSLCKDTLRGPQRTDDDTKVVFVVNRLVSPLVDVDASRLSARGRTDIELCIVESDEAKVVSTRQL